MSETPKEREWCPTQSGTMRGYRPEWITIDADKWADVPVRRQILDVSREGGAPNPYFDSGVLNAIGLFGEAQAWAIAWTFAAQMAARPGPRVQVRIVEHEVVYEIKAREVSVEGETGGE